MAKNISMIKSSLTSNPVPEDPIPIQKYGQIWKLGITEMAGELIDKRLLNGLNRFIYFEDIQ